MKFEIVNTEWAKDIEQSYNEYMSACFESIDLDEHFATESDEVFCGCNTCDVREQLVYLTPRIIDAYNKGYIKLMEDKDETPKT